MILGVNLGLGRPAWTISPLVKLALGIPFFVYYKQVFCHSQRQCHYFMSSTIPSSSHHASMVQAHRSLANSIVHKRVSQRINCNSSLLWHYFTTFIYLRSYVTYVDPTMVSFVMTVIQIPSRVTFLKFFRHDNHISIKRNPRKVFETLIIESFLDVYCFCQSS